MSQTPIVSILLGLLLASILAAAVEASPDPAAPAGMATFEYGGRSFLGGIWSGGCESGGILFPRATPGFFDFQSQGGMIEHYVTDWWGSRLDPAGRGPYYSRLHANQTSWTDPVPAGTGRVDWGATGRVRVFGNHWMDLSHHSQPDPLPVRFRLRDSNLTELSADIARWSEGYYLSQRDSLTGQIELTSTLQGGVWGWNRMVASRAGNVTATGDLTVYLQDAGVSIPRAYKYHTPAWHENASSVEGGAGQVFHYRFHHSILRFRQAEVRIDSAPPLACGRLEADVEGTLVLYGARGVAQRGNQSVRFDKQELTLGGTFHLVEEVPQEEPVFGAPGRTRSRGEGNLSIFGVDFQPVLASLEAPLDSTRFLVWAVAGAGALAGLKLFGWLFSRLSRSSAEHHPARGQLMQVFRQAQPAWQSLTQLSQETGRNPDELRHHLRALQRLGLVSVQRGRTLPLYGIPGRASELPPLLVEIRKDVWTRDLILERLTGQPRWAHALWLDLREIHKVSKQAYWKVVHKLGREGVIRVERRGREVWVCRSTPRLS